MKTETCRAISDLLVDFADDELTVEERRRVEDHLTGCRACRAELRLLERSLELARSVWHEAACSPAVVPSPTAVSPQIVPAGRFRPDRRRAIAACAAACVLLVIFASIAWRLWPPGGSSQPIPTIARQKETPPSAINDEDIDSCISRQARSARLAVAVQLLATRPELDGYRNQAEQYLAQVSRGGKAPP